MNIHNNQFTYTLLNCKVPTDQLPICNITSDSEAFGTIAINIPITINTLEAEVYHVIPPAGNIDQWSKIPGPIDQSNVLSLSRNDFNLISWTFNPVDIVDIGSGQYFSIEFFINRDSTNFDSLSCEVIIKIKDLIAFTGLTGMQPFYSQPQGQTGVQGNTGLQGVTGLANFLDIETVPPFPTPTSGPELMVSESDNALYYSVDGIWIQASSGTMAGPTGIQGLTGTQGNTGTQGLTGVQGNIGAQGNTGVQGIQGNTGIQGFTGVGSQGQTGITIFEIQVPGNETLTSVVSLVNEANSSAFADIYSFDTELIVQDSTGNLWNPYLGIFQFTTVTTGGIYSVAITSNFIWSTSKFYLKSIIGLQGSTGVQGDIGVQGNTGLKGNTGFQGITGLKGIAGLQGSTGGQGNIGIQGNTGLKGSTGFQGITGLKGNTGVQGQQGSTGVQGVRGNTGVQGQQGNTGVQGVQGNTGVQGNQGQQGLTGAQGSTGIQGNIGIQGNTGVQGIQGQQGSTGIQGNIGVQGMTGIGSQGQTGLRGNTGIQGFTGIRGQPGVQGDTGVQGLRGNTGVQGIVYETTAEFSAGAVLQIKAFPSIDPSNFVFNSTFIDGTEGAFFDATSFNIIYSNDSVPEIGNYNRLSAVLPLLDPTNQWGWVTLINDGFLTDVSNVVFSDNPVHSYVTKEDLSNGIYNPITIAGDTLDYQRGYQRLNFTDIAQTQNATDLLPANTYFSVMQTLGNEHWAGMNGTILRNASYGPLMYESIVMSETNDGPAAHIIDGAVWDGGTNRQQLSIMPILQVQTNGTPLMNVIVDTDTIPQVNIEGKITLTAVDQPSVNITPGTIIFGTDNHFYGYNGSGWVQLDNTI